MIFVIEELLDAQEIELISDSLKPEDFIDGKITAGWHAKKVKNNTQLKQKTYYGDQLKEVVKKALLNNNLFQAAVRPRKIHSLLFSRYEIGMSYGTHVDNALMGEELWRSDVSFTIFLSSPDSYGGGELVFEQGEGEHKYKLAEGSAIVYPSSTLHHVEEVTKGVRLAAVGWAQSLVRDPSKREILFDLDTVRRSIFAKEGKSVEFDLLSKSLANLLRRWAE